MTERKSRESRFRRIIDATESVVSNLTREEAAEESRKHRAEIEAFNDEIRRKAAGGKAASHEEEQPSEGANIDTTSACLEK